MNTSLRILTIGLSRRAAVSRAAGCLWSRRGCRAGETHRRSGSRKAGARTGPHGKAQEPVAAGGTPFSAGSFLVYPEIDATWMYDDNVYYSNDNPVSDHAWIYSPALWVQSDWTQHVLNFSAAWDSTRYQRYRNEDSDDWRVSGEGRYDFNANTNVYGGARFSQDHEDRESPDDTKRRHPHQVLPATVLRRLLPPDGSRLAAHRRHRAPPELRRRQLRHRQRRDQHHQQRRPRPLAVHRRRAAGLRALAPPRALPTDRARQPALRRALDDLGYQRDSDGRRYLAGIRWNVPRTLKLDAFAGRLKQDYADPRFNDVSAPVAGVALQWAVGERTVFSAYLDRTIEETTVTYTPTPGNVLVSSSYVNTYVSAGIEHRFSDKLSGRANGSVSRVAYEGFDRTDDYKGGNIGLVYRLHRNLFLDLNLAARKLDSSLPSENFTKRMVFVRIAVPFAH